MVKKKVRESLPSDTIVNIRLRLPIDLHAALTVAATTHERSLNSEILYRLNNTFNPEFLSWEAEQELKGRAEMKVLLDLLKDQKVQARVEQVVEELRAKEQRGKK